MHISLDNDIGSSVKWCWMRVRILNISIRSTRKYCVHRLYFPNTDVNIHLTFLRRKVRIYWHLCMLKLRSMILLLFVLPSIVHVVYEKNAGKRSEWHGIYIIFNPFYHFTRIFSLFSVHSAFTYVCHIVRCPNLLLSEAVSSLGRTKISHIQHFRAREKRNQKNPEPNTLILKRTHELFSRFNSHGLNERQTGIV